MGQNEPWWKWPVYSCIFKFLIIMKKPLTFTVRGFSVLINYKIYHEFGISQRKYRNLTPVPERYDMIMKNTKPMLLIDYDVRFNERQHARNHPDNDTVNFCGVFRDEEYFHKFASDPSFFSSAPMSHKINKLSKVIVHYDENGYMTHCESIA